MRVTWVFDGDLRDILWMGRMWASHLTERKDVPTM